MRPQLRVVLSRQSRNLWARLQQWHAFWHHLGLAVTVASVVGLLHHGGMLDWLDSAMLRLVASTGATRASPATADPSLPVVLLIPAALYEQAFEARSPLDRSKLASILKLLRGFTDNRPHTVVLDLDLSDPTTDDKSRLLMEEQLQGLVTDGTHLVLPLPAPAHTESHKAAKAAFIARACGWRPSVPQGQGKSTASPVSAVTFASADLSTWGGRVMRVHPANLSLGLAASHPVHADDVCDQQEKDWRLLVDASAPAALRGLSTGLHGKAALPRPFNARSLLGVNEHVLELARLDALPLAADGSAVPLAGRVVFLGGGYDPRDRVKTALETGDGPVEGVVVHAATFHSTLKPVTKATDLEAMAVDVIVGVALGYLFAWLWAWHALARKANGCKGYLWPKGIVLITISAALGSMFVLVLIAVLFFHPLNVWISPGPMLIGVFAKFALARDGHHETELHNHHPAAQGTEDQGDEVEVPSPCRWLGGATILVLALLNISAAFWPS